MKILFLLVLPVFIVKIFASDVYVNIGTAKTKKDIAYVYSKLKQMGMNMSYKTVSKGSDSFYVIYSGPYYSKANQIVALKNARYLFKNAKLVRISKNVNVPNSNENEPKDQTANTTTNTINSDEKSRLNDKSKYSIGMALGYSSAPSTHIIESGSVTITEPNNSGPSLLLNINYDLFEDFMLSLSYLRVDADDLIFDNVYGTIWYKFHKFNNFAPYFGVSLGISTLEWNASPLKNVNPGSNNDSESIIYGTEIGVKYDGYKDFFPFLNYHCMFMEHSTNLTQDTVNKSKLQHKTLHSILLGIGYKF